GCGAEAEPAEEPGDRGGIRRDRQTRQARVVRESPYGYAAAAIIEHEAALGNHVGGRAEHLVRRLAARPAQPHRVAHRGVTPRLVVDMAHPPREQPSTQ